MDPATENMMALSGQPFKAFPGQDHQAHMDAHLSFMGTMIARTNPQVLGLLQKNILEHITLMAQEQVQLEFKEELEELQKMQQQVAPMMQQMQQNPQMAQQMQQNPQMMAAQQKIQQTQTKIEARKAQLIAETMAEYLEEEKKVLNQLDTDPLLRLKNDEIQIKAINDLMDLQIDQAKLQQAFDLAQQRKETQEQIAEDRNDVNIYRINTQASLKGK